MCTRNRPDKIGQAVSSVLANDHPAIQLTIIDQSTTDETRQVLEPFLRTDERVHFVHSSTPGLSKAYNSGISSTSSEIIAFTDDDCIAPPGWVAAIVAAFEDEPDGDLLYGQVVAAHPEDGGEALTPALLITEAERLSRRDGFRVFGMGANFAARRRLFEAVGGFDEVLGGGGPLRSSQDYDLAYRTYRAGGVVLLRPEVVIRHDGRREAEDWPSLLLNYGIGDGAFYMKHVRCRDARALVLLTRKLARSSIAHVVKTALRRNGAGGSYVRGLAIGTRESFKFDVDRTSRMYSVPGAA